MSDQAQDSPDEQGTVRLSTIKLDLGSVTIGEMVALELESGTSFDRLLATRAARKAVGLWIHEHRSSAQPRSWSALMNLRPRGASASTSPEAPDGPLPRSSD